MRDICPGVIGYDQRRNMAAAKVRLARRIGAAAAPLRPGRVSRIFVPCDGDRGVAWSIDPSSVESMT
jgi:hypothetical protein